MSSVASFLNSNASASTRAFPASSPGITSTGGSASLPIPPSPATPSPSGPYTQTTPQPNQSTETPIANSSGHVPWLPPDKSTRSGTQGDQSSRRDYYNDENNIKLYCSSCDCFHNRDKFSRDKKGNVRFTCNRTRARQNESKKRKKDERGGAWGQTEEEVRNGTFGIVDPTGREDEDDSVDLINVEQLLNSTSSNNDLSIPIHQAMEEARATNKRVRLTSGRAAPASNSNDPLDLLAPLLSSSPPSREELAALTSRLSSLESRFSGNEIKLRNLSQLCINALPNLKKRLEEVRDGGVSAGGSGNAGTGDDGDSVTREELKQLKEQTTLLTSQLNTLQSFIHTSHTSVLSTLESSKTDIKTLQTDLASLKNEFSQLKSRMENWENKEAQALVADEGFVARVVEKLSYKGGN